MMNSQYIQNQIEAYAAIKGFDAPYGILTGSHVNKNGTKYLSVTFGRRRTLDATVNIYNRNFITVKTSRHGQQVFKNVQDLMDFLDTL